ncbi:unnamed protein product [Closterium sp. Naga37s-1]|nr:unnamed protein product [Closterium sp. Naga37s-1]
MPLDVANAKADGAAVAAGDGGAAADAGAAGVVREGGVDAGGDQEGQGGGLGERNEREKGVAEEGEGAEGSDKGANTSAAPSSAAGTAAGGSLSGPKRPFSLFSSPPGVLSTTSTTSETQWVLPQIALAHMHGKGKGPRDTYQWTQCVPPLPLDQLRSHGCPLPTAFTKVRPLRSQWALLPQSALVHVHGKGKGSRDTYRWTQCVPPLPLDQLRSHGCPLPAAFTKPLESQLVVPQSKCVGPSAWEGQGAERHVSLDPVCSSSPSRPTPFPRLPSPCCLHQGASKGIWGLRGLSSALVLALPTFLLLFQILESGLARDEVQWASRGILESSLAWDEVHWAPGGVWVLLILESSLAWDEVQWAPGGVWVRGLHYPVVRAHFMPRKSFSSH